jgi:hypothetical protein
MTPQAIEPACLGGLRLTAGNTQRGFLQEQAVNSQILLMYSLLHIFPLLLSIIGPHECHLSLVASMFCNHTY